MHNLGLIELGEADKLGTAIRIRTPRELPWALETLEAPAEPAAVLDYFRDPALRQQLFDRDSWRCRYCGVKVSDATATLDHIIPQAAYGSDDPTNLATACHGCNSVKSGRSEAEAAPFLLARLRDQALRQPQPPD